MERFVVASVLVLDNILHFYSKFINYVFTNHG